MARQEYFVGLLDDCLKAAREAGVHEDDEGRVVAALVLSDSLNGLRKALLQVDILRTAPLIQSKQ
jgi:hypothetical protein